MANLTEVAVDPLYHRGAAVSEFFAHSEGRHRRSTIKGLEPGELKLVEESRHVV